jgi:hypothetical protein
MKNVMERIAIRHDIRRAIGKTVPVSGEGNAGSMSLPDGHELVDLEVYIDVDALLRAVGHKAMASKRGRSALQGSAVVVQATNRRRIP